jgi:heat shock protein HslJ
VLCTVFYIAMLYNIHMKKLLYIVVILLVIAGIYLLTQGVQKSRSASVDAGMSGISDMSTGLGTNVSTNATVNSSSSMTSISNLSASSTSIVSTTTTSTKQVKQNRPVSIGGSKDSHGCVLGGGYSWDASMNACVRPWEKLSVLIPSKKWYLVNSDGTTSNSIYFETNTAGTQFSGQVCNSFSGAIKINDKASTVYVSNTVSTMMACADNDVMALESKLFTITSNTVKVSLNADNGHITLIASPSTTSTSVASSSTASQSIKMEFAPKDR